MKTDLEHYGLLLMKIVLLFVVMALFYFGITFVVPLVFTVSGNLLVYFLPFILAMVIAILIDPLVDWLQEARKMKRGAAVAITLVSALALIIAAILLISSRLIIELSDLYARLPSYTHNLINYGLGFSEKIRLYISNNPLPLEAQDALRNNLQAVISNLAALLTGVTNFLFNLLTGLPAFVTIIIIMGIATFFISRDKRAIFGLIYRLLPRKFVKPTSVVIGEISSALVGFFRAQLILISITGLITVVGLYILGMEYAVTMGIVVGIFDILPILGPGTILVPWALLQFALGSVNFGIALLILYAIAAGIRQLLEPKILSKNIGLHPLATLMSLYLGLQFFGVAGIILGPFLVIVGKAILKSRSLNN